MTSLSADAVEKLQAHREDLEALAEREDLDVSRYAAALLDLAGDTGED